MIWTRELFWTLLCTYMLKRTVRKDRSTSRYKNKGKNRKEGGFFRSMLAAYIHFPFVSIYVHIGHFPSVSVYIWDHLTLMREERTYAQTREHVHDVYKLMMMHRPSTCVWSTVSARVRGVMEHAIDMSCVQESPQWSWKIL